MEWNLELLRELCRTPGAPGREERIRAVVKSRLERLCDEVTVDRIGNVIGLRRARSAGSVAEDSRQRRPGGDGG